MMLMTSAKQGASGALFQRAEKVFSPRFSDEEEDDEDADDADECDCEDCADDTDDEDDADEEENPDDDLIAYACPNCGAELTFHANDVDFDENTLCPNCHQPIFPEIDEDSEEETEE